MFTLPLLLHHSHVFAAPSHPSFYILQRFHHRHPPLSWLWGDLLSRTCSVMSASIESEPYRTQWSHQHHYSDLNSFLINCLILIKHMSPLIMCKFHQCVCEWWLHQQSIFALHINVSTLLTGNPCILLWFCFFSFLDLNPYYMQTETCEESHAWTPVMQCSGSTTSLSFLCRAPVSLSVKSIDHKVNHGPRQWVKRVRFRHQNVLLNLNTDHGV